MTETDIHHYLKLEVEARNKKNVKGEANREQLRYPKVKTAARLEGGQYPCRNAKLMRGASIVE